MSWPHLNAALDATGLTASQKSVLIVLAARADDEGKSWPSHARIMRDTGLSRSTVKAALQSLRDDAKLIEWQHQHAAGGVYTSNSYVLRLEGVGRQMAGVGRQPTGGWADSRPGVGRELAGGGPTVGYRISNEYPKKEKVAKPPRASFEKPTLEEVASYGQTLTPPFTNAAVFVSYYESNGWRAGKNPMRDWRAAVRNWHAKDNASQTTKPYNRPLYS